MVHVSSLHNYSNYINTIQKKVPPPRRSIVINSKWMNAMYIMDHSCFKKGSIVSCIQKYSIAKLTLVMSIATCIRCIFALSCFVSLFPFVFVFLKINQQQSLVNVFLSTFDFCLIHDTYGCFLGPVMLDEFVEWLRDRKKLEN